MILSLDPSSTATGYAIFDGMKIEEAGVLKGHYKDPALKRSIDMATDALVLSLNPKIETVLVEMPSGGPGTGSRQGATTSLIIYGVAAGIIYGRLHELAKSQSWKLEAVPVETWTKGWKKKTRQAAVMARFPDYDATKDKGLDCADALALGWWWIAGKERP